MRRVLFSLWILKFKFNSVTAILIVEPHCKTTYQLHNYFFKICFNQIISIWELCLWFCLQRIICKRKQWYFWLNVVAEILLVDSTWGKIVARNFMHSILVMQIWIINCFIATSRGSCAQSDLFYDYVWNESKQSLLSLPL